MGKVYIQLANPQEAVRIFEEALDLSKRCGTQLDPTCSFEGEYTCTCLIVPVQLDLIKYRV